MLTSASPAEGEFSNVVFHQRTVDTNNDVTVDLDGECLYLESGSIPTP